MSPDTARVRAHPGTVARWTAALVPALAGAFVFRGALAYFFGQDDFLGLARVRGLAPALEGPWRWLSGQGYFALMRPFGVASAAPYHAASLVAHASSAALLGVLIARRHGAPAALLGATTFAAHPSLYTALYSVSGIGEILSGLLIFAVLLLATGGGRARWLAPVAFGAALLCKESVLLLPLALLIAPDAFAPGPPAARDPRGAPARGIAWVLAALALGYAALLFGADVFAVRSGLSSHSPYAFSLDPHALANAATYVGWAVLPWLPLAHGFQDAVEPSLYPAAAVAVAMWTAGCLVPRLRDAGWPAGGLLFLVLLLPVLPLRNHTYHYYLYAPLAGASWCLAALFRAAQDTLGRRAGAESGAPFALTWAMSLALAALVTWNGAAFVRRIETQPFSDPKLRADAVVDRALIAQRVRDGLAAAPIPEGTAIAFWSPWLLLDQARASAGVAADVETYGEMNVRSALMDGLAVRVLFPAVREVRFMHRFEPLPAESRVALYQADGTLRLERPEVVESMLAEHPIPGARP